MQLTRLFIVHTMRVFLMLLCGMAPILYLCDLAFADNFQPLYALIQLPFRYGQALNTLVLWSVWLGVKTMRRNYSDVFFISIGFIPRHAYRVLLVLSLSFMLFDAFVLIPSNKLFFPEKVMTTTWSIQKFNLDNARCSANPSRCSVLQDHISKQNNRQDNLRTMFVHKTDSSVQLWYIDKEVTFKEFSVPANKHDEIILDSKKVSLKEDSFFILWNDPKKMSFGGLARCEKYMQYHNLDTSDIHLQWHVFVSRIFLLMSVTIMGFALGWRRGINGVIICSIMTTWLGQIVIFMPPTIGILVSWCNVIVWMVLGCILL